MIEKKRPSSLELEAMLNSGMSLTEISRQVGYSVTYLSSLCKGYGLEIPPIGRPKGYKMSDESKAKISESNRKGE